MARLTKKEIIDYLVLEATSGLFFGDGRDSKAPPSGLQSVTEEVFRCGAKALRARLSGLSYRQVLQEGTAAIEHKKRAEALGLASIGEFERAKREERIRQVAAATTAKRNTSQSVGDAVRELAGPLLNKHPKWTSNRCAVEIQEQLNTVLQIQGHRPLGLDAIRKRVEKCRTHAR
jgi:hypothetical protein